MLLVARICSPEAGTKGKLCNAVLLDRDNIYMGNIGCGEGCKTDIKSYLGTLNSRARRSRLLLLREEQF